jgi:CobQ/CobB/MinD/ParA nucleotide binding domain
VDPTRVANGSTKVAAIHGDVGGRTSRVVSEAARVDPTWVESGSTEVAAIQGDVGGSTSRVVSEAARVDPIRIAKGLTEVAAIHGDVGGSTSRVVSEAARGGSYAGRKRHYRGCGDRWRRRRPGSKTTTAIKGSFVPHEDTEEI